MNKLPITLIAALALCGASHAQVAVEAAWARPTVQGQMAGGGFLRLKSAEADRLLGAQTPAAQSVELHEMKLEGDTMRMREVGGVDLPAGTPVELKPGGLHLMLMGLRAPLKAGTRFPLTLKLQKAGDVTVDVEVRP